MIKESKKIEFWNYLTTERNKARPKGITMQRLGVVKPVAIASNLWVDVIERCGATELTAQEFYQSSDPASTDSRTIFWEAVRGIILQGENDRKTRGVQNRNSSTPATAGKSRRNLKKNARKRS